MEPVFDNGIFWHRVTTALFQGGAIAMAFALIVRLLSLKDWYVRGVNMRLANGTAVALLAVWNLAFAILAMVTGLWMTWGFDIVTSMSLTINKAMFGSFSLLSLILMLWLRYRYGQDVWNSGSLRTVYVVLGLIVAGVAIANGSLGGEAGLLGTIMEPVWDLLNINVRSAMVLPTVGGIILVVAVLLLSGLAVFSKLVRRRA